MYLEEFSAVAQSAKIKKEFLNNNPKGYFISSMLAGAFVGFGIILIYTIGGMLQGQPYMKIVMGASFGIALSLVIIGGAELFTGTNFVMASGALAKNVNWNDAWKIWITSYIGNWVGSIILSLLFYGTGLATGDVGGFMAMTALKKMHEPLMPLFIRAMLCNTLVCLAVWCGYRCKSESGKLIMIFWCLFAFITCGFEHSVANMTLLTMSLLEPSGVAVSIGGYFYNIFIVGLGNLTGAILFLAVPYYMISKKKEG